MIIRFLIIGALAILCGCINSPWTPVALTDITEAQVKDTIQKSYQLGVKQMAMVGESIVKQTPFVLSNACESKTMVFEEDFSVTAKYMNRVPRTANINIKKDKDYLILGKTGNGETIVEVFESPTSPYGLVFDNDGHASDMYIYSPWWNGGFWTVDSIRYSAPKVTGKPIKKCAEPRSEIAGTPWELVYSGKNSSSLNIKYREYSDHLHARQVFYQDLTYEPDVKQIRFRNLIIDLHDTTSDSLTYTVVSD